MFKSSPIHLAAALAVLALAGCSGEELTRNFGLTSDAPDEFTVTTRAPLTLPPDYSLRPPRPGASRPMEQTPRQAAEAALVPQAALSNGNGGDMSPGQQALIAAAGPSAPADIRRRVDNDAARNSDTSFTDKVMFWRTPEKPGTVVDPQREAQRLRENAALGQSEQVGDTPIIQRRKDSFFDAVF